jgi:hypothetical protein
MNSTLALGMCLPKHTLPDLLRIADLVVDSLRRSYPQMMRSPHIAAISDFLADAPKRARLIYHGSEVNASIFGKFLKIQYYQSFCALFRKR